MEKDFLIQQLNMQSMSLEEAQRAIQIKNNQENQESHMIGQPICVGTKCEIGQQKSIMNTLKNNKYIILILIVFIIIFGLYFKGYLKNPFNKNVKETVSAVKNSTKTAVKIAVPES